MAKKKKNKSNGDNKAISRKELKRSLLEIFENNPGKPFNYKQLSAKLEIKSKKDREKLIHVLQKLEEKNTLEEDRPGWFYYEFKSREVTGTVDMTRKGHAYILVEDKEEDVYVPSGKLKTALNGDTVKVALYAKRKRRRTEGEVIEIISRKRSEFVGTVEISKSYGFLVPDDRKQINVDIFIPPDNLGEVKNGDKAVAEIVEWPENASNPVGKITEVLGRPGTHKTEMHAIIKSFGLPVRFPKKVEDEVQHLPERISEKDIAGRKDFRDVPLFTIDPPDAKDFDDALSIRPGKQKNTWEVGIHIADVTHYVKPGTILDQEAYNRATSVYLVDRVIPMLPEKLSNELCSLRPNEDKLAFSAVFELNDQAEVLNQWFGKTVIRSGNRFTYDEAQSVIDSKEGKFAKEILKLNELAGHLRKRKFEQGAISFETQEVKFELDEEGVPLKVIPLVRKDAHKMIEDFMLLANKEVAGFILKKGGSIVKNPSVYRVHDAPDSKKLESFSKIAARFGYKMDTRNNKTLAVSFNRLLEDVEGKPEQNLLQSLAIRTMAKAFYTTKKSDHYGLAFEHYTHFTSPIRRYPDVIVHRLLNAYLHDEVPMEKDDIERQCKHSSEREVQAVEAERASVKYKQVEYLGKFIGEEFDGIISGVTEWGFFTELRENKCEGLVHITSLIDDYYFLDDDNYRLVGTNKGKTYQLGDSVRIRVMEVDMVKRTAVFDVV